MLWTRWDHHLLYYKYADAPCPPYICRDYALLIEYVLLQNPDLDELIEGQKSPTFHRLHHYGSQP